jgi:hypothetical protein
MSENPPPNSTGRWLTRRQRYLDENLGALAVTLTPAEQRELSANFPPDTAAGSRYPEAMMSAFGR